MSLTQNRYDRLNAKAAILPMATATPTGARLGRLERYQTELVDRTSKITST